MLKKKYIFYYKKAFKFWILVNKMVTKEDILNKISGKSDEIKLEFLEKTVKTMENDQETRKLAFLIMAELYIKKMWWTNAARAYQNAADLAKTFDEKKDLFFKSGTLFVRAEDYFTAEDTFRKTLVLALKKEREPLKEKVIQVYLDLGKEYENKRMQTKAISLYNKTLTLNLPLEKANEIRDKIAILYEKIGKPREATWVRQQKASAIESVKKKEIPLEEDEVNAQDLIG